MAEPALPIFSEAAREPFTTLDGSTVREQVQTRDGARAQSLAEAVVPPGGETIEHLHRRGKVWNPGPEPLVLLCCSAPPYADADTELLE
jgi:hypothetical protein